MKTPISISTAVWLSMMTFIWSGAALSVRAEDRLVEGAMILAPRGEDPRMANFSDDTLTACLAKIPTQLSPQQRLSAQQICQQEEAKRQFVPLEVKEGD